MGPDADKFEERARRLDESLNLLGRWELRYFIITMSVGIVVALVLVLMNW
jgi:hypothetical protein